MSIKFIQIIQKKTHLIIIKANYFYDLAGDFEANFFIISNTFSRGSFSTETLVSTPCSYLNILN